MKYSNFLYIKQNFNSGNEEILRLAKEKLKVSEINPESGALMSYDTTFCEQCLKIKKLKIILNKISQ